MLGYTAPLTLQEAVRMLTGAPGVAKILSGGTDLLVQLRSGRTKPDLIVDIKKIPGISGIRERDGAFVIGAATPGTKMTLKVKLHYWREGRVEYVELPQDAALDLSGK